VIAIITLAATVGGYSRRWASATTRFVLFLTITVHATAATSDPAGLVFLVVAAALWTSLLSLVLGGLLRAHRRGDPSIEGGARPDATRSQKYARWKRSLRQLSGWQYPLRLGSCLSIASALRWSWPGHHLHWIALTVVILTHRRLEPVPIKATQRALGTVLGVVIASLFVAYKPRAWGLVVCIGLLAAARPLLKARNYLAYSAVMTPLILLIMDGGQPLGVGVLADRLIATVIGAALVISANLIQARRAR